MNYILLSLAGLFLLFFSSCGLSEVTDIEQIEVKASPKIVLPVAFGSIDVETLFYYINPTNTEYPPDENGYYFFEQIITEVSIPDTIAFDGTLFENLSGIELRVETNNHLPLGLDLEFFFVDSSTFVSYGDPISSAFIKPATINSEGKAISSTHHIESIVLESSTLPIYSQANAIIVLLNFYLPPSESNNIFLHINDSFSMNIGMVLQVSTEEQASANELP